MSTPEGRLEEAERTGDRAAARAAAEEILSARGDKLPPQARGGLCFLIADGIMEQPAPSIADLDIAIGHLRTAIPLLTHLPDSVAEAYLQIGRAETERASSSDPDALDRAMLALNEAKARRTGESDVAKLAEIAYAIGIAHEKLGDSGAARLRLAQAAFRESHTLFTQTDRRLGQGSLAYHVGRIALRIFDLEKDAEPLAKARSFLDEALEIYDAAGLPEEAQDAIDLLGEIQARLEPGLEVPAPDTGDQPQTREAGTSNEEITLQDVLAYTLNPEMRRHMLASWVEHHVSADAERAQYLHQLMIRPLESEGEAMRQAALEKKDEVLLARADQHMRDCDAHYEYLLKVDRESDTHQRALTIVSAHLERGEPFVLLLRNFDLEIDKGKAPKEFEKSFETYGPIQYLSSVAVKSNDRMDDFERALTASITALQVSDAADALQTRDPGGVSALRVLSSEWQAVVSMLIGEAAAIVVFAQHFTEGLATELGLIREHQAAGKTTILLLDPEEDTTDLLGGYLQGREPKRVRTAFEVLPEALRKRFGDTLARVEKLTGENVVAIVDVIAKSVKEGHGPAAKRGSTAFPPGNSV